MLGKGCFSAVNGADAVGRLGALRDSSRNFFDLDEVFNLEVGTCDNMVSGIGSSCARTVADSLGVVL